MLMFMVVVIGVPTSILGSWNNKNEYGSVCIPAVHCTVENVCYCSNKFDGWMNGGAITMNTYHSGGPFCVKNGKYCECNDCGYWIAPYDQCQESRCDDTIGVEESGTCFHVDPVTKSKVQKPSEVQFNCYRVKVACDPSICNYGKKLTGCERVSPGSCTDCPTLANGFFWMKKGNCGQSRCSTAVAGKFESKACTSTADAVISDCSTHPGNRKYIVPRQDDKDTYYCPRGGLVIPPPANSMPTVDYSDFVCVDGYYLSGSTCLPCLPGSVCKYGKKYICPVHYYTSTFAMSYCNRCSTPDECHLISKWENPIRCIQGSTANVGCVACGGCSWDPRQGLACVTESYEMQGLPQRCDPVNSDSGVAVCQLMTIMTL
jgi:hypothetical protein